MISPQLIIRYPFFADLDHEYNALLTTVGESNSVQPGHYFFCEGDELDRFYLVVEGEVAITLDIPDRRVEQTFQMQLSRNLVTEAITVSIVRPGEMFGWSALVPPHTATAGARANKTTQVLAFDCAKLRPIFEEDCHFAYLMMLKAAQTIRERLRDSRIEMLATYVK